MREAKKNEIECVLRIRCFPMAFLSQLISLFLIAHSLYSQHIRPANRCHRHVRDVSHASDCEELLVGLVKEDGFRILHRAETQRIGAQLQAVLA